jgi:phosphate starvation-inducible protein PhoH
VTGVQTCALPIWFCRFTEIDVVRHPIVQEIIKAYERYEKRG